MRKKKADGDVDAPVEQAERGTRLTPLDIQQKEFRSSFRGYHEGEVDAYLDHVTEELGAILEENKRLREAAGPAGSELADAARQAEQILEQARVQAAGIIRGAEMRSASDASAPAGPTDVVAIAAFLAQERQFLQSMAGLIQGHAESVKRSARSAMGSQGGVAGTPASPASPPRVEQPTPPVRPKVPEPVETQAMQPVRIPDEVPAQPTPRPAPASPAQRPAPEEPAPREPASGEGAEEGASVGAVPGSSPEEDPSLRELFWGEE